MKFSKWSTRKFADRLMAAWTVLAILLMLLLTRFYLGLEGQAFWGFAALVVIVVGGSGVGGFYLLNRELSAREVDSRALPDRPEFYDYGLLNLPRHAEELGGKRITDIAYTVFDTETTGLRPSQGDEIISIGAVVVRDCKVVHEPVFDVWVDPARPIPKASTRIHGITDEMVQGQPAIDVRLGEFQEFVGDSVLVAHSAPFDMKFLKLKEAETGISFDHLVLDTLLISVFLDRDEKDQSFEAIAKRHGVRIKGRHSAIGDAMATAEIFAVMLQRLPDRGVTTLDQLIRACEVMTAVRKLQEQQGT